MAAFIFVKYNSKVSRLIIILLIWMLYIFSLMTPAIDWIDYHYGLSGFYTSFRISSGLDILSYGWLGIFLKIPAALPPNKIFCVFE